MKFKVIVDETVWAVNTYLIEAESEEALRMDIHDGNIEGIQELVETFSDTSVITNIRSVRPFIETP